MTTDKQQIKQHFAHSANTYDGAATVQRQIAESLAKTAIPFLPADARIFEIGCGTGTLTTHLIDHAAHYFANDISEEMLATTARKLNSAHLTTLCGDAETMAWANNINAVVSSAAVQWFANPLSLIAKAANSLNHNGVLAFTTFGANTFCELRTAGATGLHYPSFLEWTNEITKHFDIKTAEETTIVDHFDNARQLFENIRKTGVGASQQRMTITQMRNLERTLENSFRSTQGISLTYQIFTFVGMRKE